MPPPMTTTRAVSVTAALDSESLLAEVGADPLGLALAEADRDPQLLEILVEDLPAELDPVGREEGTHLRLPLRAHQRAHAVEQPAERARRIEPPHALPVALHELPRLPARPHARQHRADDVGRVLAPDLAVHGELKRLGDEV